MNVTEIAATVSRIVGAEFARRTGLAAVSLPAIQDTHRFNSPSVVALNLRDRSAVSAPFRIRSHIHFSICARSKICGTAAAPFPSSVSLNPPGIGCLVSATIKL